MQHRFGALALSDVRLGAGHAQCAPAGVTLGNAAVMHPFPSAVFATNPVFLIETGALPFHMGLQCLVHALCIVGVNALAPVAIVLPKFAVLITAQVFPLRRQEHPFVGDVPIPDAVAHTFNYQVVARSALAQFALYGVALGNVLQHVKIHAWQHVGHGGKLDHARRLVLAENTYQATFATLGQQLRHACVYLPRRCNHNVAELHRQDFFTRAAQQLAGSGIDINTMLLLVG